MTKSINDWKVGARVQAGSYGTDAYDTGNVLSVDDAGVLVGWDSGVRTVCDPAELDVEVSDAVRDCDRLYDGD